MTPLTATPIQAQFVASMLARGWYPDRLRIDVASKDLTPLPAAERPSSTAGGTAVVITC